MCVFLFLCQSNLTNNINNTHIICFYFHCRCTIQNSVLCHNAVIENNCSLNDVQVAEGCTVVAGSKLKADTVTN